MKRLIAIIIVIAVAFGTIACMPLNSPAFWRTMIVYSAESANTTSIAGNIMAVFYTKADQRVLFWVTDCQIVDNGDGTWDVTSPQRRVSGVNQALVTYGLYKYTPIALSETEPTYLADLSLEAITADDLPRSHHIGKLTAVNTALARPATVTRKYYGVTYDVQCLVEQDIVDMYLSGDLNIGDFVNFVYIDEIPDTTEINIAIITGKVYKSWP